MSASALSASTIDQVKANHYVQDDKDEGTDDSTDDDSIPLILGKFGISSEIEIV